MAARAAAFKMLPHARALRCHTAPRALPPLPPVASSSPLAPAAACAPMGMRRHVGVLPAPLRSQGLCAVPLGRRRRLHVRAGTSLTPVRPSSSPDTEDLPRASPSTTVRLHAVHILHTTHSIDLPCFIRHSRELSRKGMDGMINCGSSCTMAKECTYRPRVPMDSPHPMRRTRTTPRAQGGGIGSG